MLKSVANFDLVSWKHQFVLIFISASFQLIKWLQADLAFLNELIFPFFYFLFFIAVIFQGTVANKFYVHNDIFRYQDEVFGDSDSEPPEGESLILLLYFRHLQSNRSPKCSRCEQMTSFISCCSQSLRRTWRIWSECTHLRWSRRSLLDTTNRHLGKLCSV